MSTMAARRYLLLALALAVGARAEAPPPLAVLSSSQVTDALYETMNWYRTLGSQSASGGEAGDALIFYANRQIATQVVHLALDMARADAELLSSQDGHAASSTGVSASADTLNAQRGQLDAQARQIQSELQSTRAAAGSSSGQRSYSAAKASELEGELAVVNARSNLLSTMAQYVNETDAKSAGANALKQQVAAIEASLPNQTNSADSPPAALSANATVRRLGIWDLAANALSLSGKIGAIDSMDRSTAHLEQRLQKLSATPVAAIKALATSSDALAAEADHANSTTMKGVRDQLDTVAWQFKQTSAIVLPLGKMHVLLEQYRHNLSSWRQLVVRQEHATLIGLGIRVGILALVLVVLFTGAEFWRRAVLRFEHDARRRNQWLVVRRVTLWTLVILVIGFTFVSELSSVATFAGLITAGLAVAMQSVIVSVVGYFFLIGKYGVRLGDRVQIGEVTGEVVELGLVRMHLMELSPQSNFAPTGRIVAFANSVVFQASGGLFRQIPGVNFAWHDLTLTLPAGIDDAAAKEAMRDAVVEVVKQYQDNMVRQGGQLQEALAARDSGKSASPRVQLHFSASEVTAHVWYPVYLPRAAEIDERVSQELWKAIAAVQHGSEPHSGMDPALAEQPHRHQ
jgi:small-conductance mechanosensitive channel